MLKHPHSEQSSHDNLKNNNIENAHFCHARSAVGGGVARHTVASSALIRATGMPYTKGVSAIAATTIAGCTDGARSGVRAAAEAAAALGAGHRVALRIAAAGRGR